MSTQGRDSKNPAPNAGQEDSSSAADGRVVPMLQPMRRVHGTRDACFSPLALYALTRCDNREPTAAERELFWTEKPVKTVGKWGIKFGGEWYSSPELIPWTTRNTKDPSPELVMRYDRALFARGQLQEISVYEVEPGDKRRFICTAHYRGEPLSELEAEEMIRARAKHVRRLKMESKLSEHGYRMLEAGESHAEEVMKIDAARRRRQERSRPQPDPARPIYEDDDDEDTDRQALQQNLEAQATEEPADSEETVDAAVEDERMAQQRQLRDRKRAESGDESGEEEI